MLYTLQKPWAKLLCIGLNLRRNMSKQKLKPNSNYAKSIKTFIVSYTRWKEESLMSHWIWHCGKSIQIRSFFWSLFSCIRTEYGDLRSKNSLIYFNYVIWNWLPIEIRGDYSILPFVTKIKQRKPIACPCTFCKSYIGRVGYIKVSDY